MVTKFVTAGGLRIDTIISHEGEALVGVPGGNAVYAAVGAAIWADNVNLWGRIGANYPETWLDELEKHGLGTTGSNNPEDIVDPIH